MEKQWKRLLTALLVSSSVFAVTWYWYQFSSKDNSSRGNEKPLAYVGKVVDDIQRRPSSRLLWQLVNTGEPLYNGEAIRTSELGEVRIQFVDSDRYLDLEPESLIVIKKSEGEIALDLMEGSLFVAPASGNDKATAPGLVLNSLNGKVDLSNASASLSVGRGAGVDVQILEGKASIKGQDGKSKDLKSASEIRILSPLPQKPIAMNAESPDPVLFSWLGFNPETPVALWVGPNRKQMKEVIKGLKGSKVLVNLPFGRHFWKLVATTPDGTVTESSIYKTEVLPRYAPTMVFPLANGEISTSKLPYDLTFKWQTGEGTRQLTLEVWRDPDLREKITTKTFTTEDSFMMPAITAGTYYWRMTSYFVDTEKPIAGKIQEFTILPPAQLATAKEEPKPAPPAVEVQFTMNESNLTQYYVEKPQVGISWTAENANHVASWRVKLLSENENPSTAEVIEVKETKLAKTVKKPGRYIASIEALDTAGLVVGTGTSKTLTVAPLPLLKAPQLTSSEEILEATLDGKTQLEWSKVEGAKEYWVTISKDGKELKRSKYTSTTTAFKNLLPGEYEVQVSAVDAFGRSSEPGTPRKLFVSDKSNVKAPTLKKIKVN